MLNNFKTCKIMKELKRLSLHNLSKSEIAKKEQNFIKGGVCGCACTCSCSSWNYGGNYYDTDPAYLSTENYNANQAANSNYAN